MSNITKEEFYEEMKQDENRDILHDRQMRNKDYFFENSEFYLLYNAFTKVAKQAEHYDITKDTIIQRLAESL